jgi:hypothetical protein
MRAYIIKTAAAALLLGAATVPSYALTVGLGGGGGNVASVSSGNTANTNTKGTVSTNPGSLLSATSANGQTNAAVNLGSLTNGINGVTNGGGLPGLGTVPPVSVDIGGGGAGAGGGGLNTGAVTAQLSNMGGGQAAALRIRCASIMASPGAFDAQLVALCRIIAHAR